MHVSCPSLMCDINQQKCIQELFSDYFLLPGHTLALGSSRAKPEHVQPSFFQSGNLVGSQRVVKKEGGGVFSLCVHICWVMCSLLLYNTHIYTHTLWILGFMEEAACSQLLNTVTVWFTKSSFHKGILTCCILDWQRQPLRVESLLLEDREWWLFWFLPHSSRGYPTPSHLTLLISVDIGLVQSFSLEKLRFSCGGVPGTRVWVCVYRDLQATK